MRPPCSYRRTQTARLINSGRFHRLLGGCRTSSRCRDDQLVGDVDGLMAVAATQGGLFRADQARFHRISRNWIAHRNGQSLSTVLPGIYWTSTGPPPRDVQLDAALLYAGPHALLSHWTAAELWKLRDVARPEVHVTAPLRRDVADVPGRLVAHRSADLGDAVRRTRDERAVTALERTIVDLCTTIGSRREVRALAADAVQRRLTVPSRLVREIGRRPSLPGLKTLADVLGAVSDGARSVLELELREHMATGGVVAPLHGAPVHGRSGQCYEVDNLWPEKRLIVEVDGREWHLSPDDWESDLDRMTDLVDAGYRLLRFTAAAIRRRTNQTLATIRRQIAVPPPREVDQACG
ncbi:MAG: hypothetical protein QOG49_1804 [Frankiaceae bacterium]|nr:hypothetical protein [Frankiaceae bacterium]